MREERIKKTKEKVIKQFEKLSLDDMNEVIKEMMRVIEVRTRIIFPSKEKK